ncbi:Ribosomal RNA-processing protein 8 [Madurella mycetomatis]|uniref:Ribosomal RNA-processing protein 8 n=1 Tax=Madurella mycetomatis TaxID=100816 RepID=A0A175W291_9PEZI|nr:Ribosomal RNA-processing protein 8 [Madurella mycetomatis]
MFPVKGLSISAEKLKVETETSPAAAPSASKPSRKRKRHGNTGNVTAANLGDLWERVIEHKAPANGDKSQPKKESKRQKTQHGSADPSSPAAKQSNSQLGSKGQQNQSGSKKERNKNRDKRKEKRDVPEPAPKPTEEDEDEWNGLDDGGQALEAIQLVKEEKTEKKEKKQRRQDGTPGSKDSKKRDGDKKPRDETATPPSATLAPATTKLTPLQASMREKLVSARFRHLNETLYTRPSAEAFQLFQDSPEMFTEYHEGFRRQVDVWPENPVDIYISDIKARAKVRFPPRNRNQPIFPSQLPLPKPPNARTTTIADLGCGDAKLSSALQPFKSKLHIDIHSFDLQTGGSPLVTRADIANLPLADGSVDVAIFCLALMGTNWTDFVEEAYRVLRWKGELWVAEIKSRFAGDPSSSSSGGSSSTKKGAVVAHSVGNRRKNAAAVSSVPPKKGRASTARDAEDEEAANLADLAVHVDGVEPGRGKQDTDISAFVEALRKRGFLLNRDLGENAVDMSNKMFVRMHFVKGAPAVKGKYAAAEGGSGVKARGGKDRPAGKKFIEGDEDKDNAGNEAKLLKPCVYKLR